MINTLKNARVGIPTILSGDFNSSPDSNVVGYLTRADHTVVAHPKVKEPRRVFYEQVNNKLTSELKGKFASAYAQFSAEGHPPFTAYSDFKSNIDYITYTKGDFALISLLEMPTKLE